MSVSTAIAVKKEITTRRANKVYTLSEYLEREERSMEKHEFYNGTIVKIQNTKYTHNLVALNVACSLRNTLKREQKKYIVLGGGQKVYIEAENVAVYPDALVIFEKPIFYERREDLLLNPIVVVEVLSRKTMLYDRTAKFDLYQAIPSFKEYVLINPTKKSVETRYQESEGLWRITHYTTDEQPIALKSLGISIEMADIYENVTF
jgi:Uma2 family endonuclease